MPEKRIFKRRQLIYYMKVLEQDTDRLFGFLVDITTEGIMIMCETPAEMDKTYRLKIPLKKELSDLELLTFDATCKWCNKNLR